MDRINSTMNKKECTFGELEVIVYDIIDTLPHLDYNALHEEAQDMVVKTSDNPTTFQLLEQMEKVQQYKNRLGEIMTDVEHEYATRKRCMELLYAANNLSSNQKSVDKRQGEAMLRYPNLVLQFGRIESFRTELLNIMNNLKSVGDMISRQASIISMQMQLGEYRKKTSLDFNHGPEAEDVMDYKSGAPEIDWSDV
jgi:hypothetical protein